MQTVSGGWALGNATRPIAGGHATRIRLGREIARAGRVHIRDLLILTGSPKVRVGDGFDLAAIPVALLFITVRGLGHGDGTGSDQRCHDARP